MFRFTCSVMYPPHTAFGSRSKDSCFHVFAGLPSWLVAKGTFFRGVSEGVR